MPHLDILGHLTRCARRYGDVARIAYEGKPSLLLSNPADVEYVLSTRHKDMVKGEGLRPARRVFGNGLLTSDGDQWRRQRQLVHPAFRAARTEATAPDMVAAAGRCCAHWRDGETRDIYRDMAQLTLEIAGRAFFGSEMGADAEEVCDAVKIVLNRVVEASGFLGFVSVSVPPGRGRFRSALQRLKSAMERAIEARRPTAHERDDLLSLLIRAQADDADPMGMMELRSMAITMLIASHETTGIALGWAWRLLSLDPAAQARLQAELRDVLGDREPELSDIARLPFTGAVIKEALRLYPPAWVFGRAPTVPMAVGGYAVAKGTSLLVSPWVLQRDARHFSRADEFVPERWLDDPAPARGSYIPFGVGPRACVGQAFAVQEAILVLATVARRWSVTAAGGSVDPWPCTTLRPKGGVHVTLTAAR